MSRKHSSSKKKRNMIRNSNLPSSDRKNVANQNNDSPVNFYMDINENLYNYNHVSRGNHFESPSKQNNTNYNICQAELGSINSEKLLKNISDNKKKLLDLAFSNGKESKNNLSIEKSTYRHSSARIRDNRKI